MHIHHSELWNHCNDQLIDLYSNNDEVCICFDVLLCWLKVCRYLKKWAVTWFHVISWFTDMKYKYVLVLFSVCHLYHICCNQSLEPRHCNTAINSFKISLYLIYSGISQYIDIALINVNFIFISAHQNVQVSR